VLSAQIHVVGSGVEPPSDARAPRTRDVHRAVRRSRSAPARLSAQAARKIRALAETVIGLFKTELIKPRGPWHTAEYVEAATLHYVHWFNHHRLLEINGDILPIELEQAYYRQHTDLAEVG
jgi:transposase InsO family protein